MFELPTIEKLNWFRLSIDILPSPSNNPLIKWFISSSGIFGNIALIVLFLLHPISLNFEDSFIDDILSEI